MKKTILGLLVAALLAIPVAAQATYDPIDAGKAQILLDRGFVSLLAKDGIKVSAKGGARRHGRNLALQVGGGKLDPTIGMGEIEAEGTLTFSGKRGKVPLRGIGILTKRDTLTARVGGSRLKIATSTERSTKRSGFGVAYSAKRLKLTAKLASRLNKKLRPQPPFFAGQLVGNLTANAQPALATILPQGSVSISLDPSFTSKMDSLLVAVNPIFPAEHSGAFAFPIATGGSLAPDGLEGTLRTAGGFEFLRAGGGQAFQVEPWLDMGIRSQTAEVETRDVPAAGKLGRIGAYDFGSAEISPDAKRRTISVSGPLTLTASSAQTFNEAFAEGNAAFSAGDLLGTLGFVAVGQ